MIATVADQGEPAGRALPSWHPRSFQRSRSGAVTEKDVQAFQNLHAAHDSYRRPTLDRSNKVDASNQPETADRNANLNAAQEAVDKGISTKCNAVANLDLDGPAVAWGLSFRKDSAAECCEACMRHTKQPGQAGACNSWVWCPEAVCWAPDIWNHTYKECWLKVQDDFRAPKVNHKGEFSVKFRSEHQTAPSHTPWIAGVIDRGLL
eukprot:CAMPEP_0198228062 /NCGR_PEP_ID=MMETSP1445-20131203/111713_1 /TAXON_ID=36898 /ORGANISM="Pyramimonas sp., Strain CCMP2087" /LENGTH=205 /DNA_ID=CAMNT_0043908311 /DNA_START=391 /DNA_END=1008 /DNA_ORIENTATION=+